MGFQGSWWVLIAPEGSFWVCTLISRPFFIDSFYQTLHESILDGYRSWWILTGPEGSDTGVNISTKVPFSFRASYFKSKFLPQQKINFSNQTPFVIEFYYFLSYNFCKVISILVTSQMAAIKEEIFTPGLTGLN